MDEPRTAPAPHPAMPPRATRPSPLGFAMTVGCVAFALVSLGHVGLSVERLVGGLPSIGRMLEQMFPPDLSRASAIGAALLETFQMAVVGTAIGVVLSVPLAIGAARGLSPGPVTYVLCRTVVAFFRTVPDLVWALVFVIAVGLGPAAGTLAIAIDTVGFCGRFFAEAMEESDQGPREALGALGANRTGIIACAVLPQVMPSFVATSLFALEKATRSSVVLGLVGAGGIGMELKVAMDLFSYDTAATVILAVFALVLVVEQVSARVRAAIL